MRGISPKQKEVLEMITDFMGKYGFPPTRREIADELGFKSANSAELHLQAMHKKGLITLKSGSQRGISLIKQDEKPGKDGKHDPEIMAQALRVIFTLASHDHEKGERRALDPKHVLDLCNKALRLEAA